MSKIITMILMGGSAMAAATSEGESSNDNKIPDTLKPLFGSLHNNEANS